MPQTKSTPKISANVPPDLKRWLRQRAFDHEIEITDMIIEALQDYKKKVEKQNAR